MTVSERPVAWSVCVASGEVTSPEGQGFGPAHSQPRTVRRHRRSRVVRFACHGIEGEVDLFSCVARETLCPYSHGARWLELPRQLPAEGWPGYAKRVARWLRSEPLEQHSAILDMLVIAVTYPQALQGLLPFARAVRVLVLSRPGSPSPAPASPAMPSQASHQKASSSPRPGKSAACSACSAGRPQTNSTPGGGHDGATATRNAHGTATTSDNAGKTGRPAGVLA